MLKENRKSLICKIHIAKQQLAIDEMSYRMLLKRLTNKESCKLMTVAELSLVLHEMKQKGFKVKSPRFVDGRKKSPTTSESIGHSRIITKLRAMWINMYKAGKLRDGSEDALRRFALNIVNQSLRQQGSNLLMLNLESLDDRQASLVLERLKKWNNRPQQKQENNR